MHLSENLKFHLEHDIPVLESIFRVGSKSYIDTIAEARKMWQVAPFSVHEKDRELFEGTDLGKFGSYEGNIVPLDLPLEDSGDYFFEAEYKGKEVKLNRPMRSSGPKKYKVYVKNPKTGKVKVVHFGDSTGGLRAKVSDPDARRAFSARHSCDEKTDKTTPGYWACRLTKFGHLFGNNKTYSGYW